MTESRSDQHEKCMDILLEEAESYVHIFGEEERDQADAIDVVKVRSFRDTQVSYELSFTNTGLISGFSCPFMKRSFVVYKHIYMACCVCGYGIYFDARHWDKSISSKVSQAPGREPQEERIKIKEIAE